MFKQQVDRLWSAIEKIAALGSLLFASAALVLSIRSCAQAEKSLELAELAHRRSSGPNVQVIAAEAERTYLELDEKGTRYDVCLFASLQFQNVGDASVQFTGVEWESIEPEDRPGSDVWLVVYDSNEYHDLSRFRSDPLQLAFSFLDAGEEKSMDVVYHWRSSSQDPSLPMPNVQIKFLLSNGESLIVRPQIIRGVPAEMLSVAEGCKAEWIVSGWEPRNLP